MFGESFRYATASFRGSTQHFTDPGEPCAKTGVGTRIGRPATRAEAIAASHLTCAGLRLAEIPPRKKSRRSTVPGSARARRV